MEPNILLGYSTISPFIKTNFMSPTHVLPWRPSAQSIPVDRYTAPPARDGLALPFLDYAGLRKFGSLSKHLRFQLEKQLANEKMLELSTLITGLGARTPLHESMLADVAKEIGVLDERVAAPLWRRLELQFICMADNDIDVCPEADKAQLLEKFIDLSKRSLPAEIHSQVLTEMTGIVNRSFNGSDDTCAALGSLFAHSRELPIQHRAAPLRSLSLALPMGSSVEFRPQINQLLDAMRGEVRLLSQEAQSAIKTDMHKVSVFADALFDAFTRVTELPTRAARTRLSRLIEKALTLEHNCADPLITSTLRFFSAQSQLLDAKMLAGMVPKLGLIPDLKNRAARLSILVQMANVFPADARAPLLKKMADVATSLSEADRKRILRGLYRNLLDMNANDQRDLVQHLDVLGTSLPVAQIVAVLVTLPTALQRQVRDTMRLT